MTSVALERDASDETLEELEALARELGRHDLPARIAELDAETLQALGIDAEGGRTLLNLLFEKLGDILGAGQCLEIASFGKFKIKPYRPAVPARIGDHSFVEAPYLGPIEFSASALLQRQLDSGTLDREMVARCDVLYSALRDDPRVPRGRSPQLIKGAFRALTVVLISHNSVELPGVGLLVARPRPSVLSVDVQAGSVQSRSGFKAILLRPSPVLIARIPGLVTLKDPPPRVMPPPLLVKLEPEDDTDDA